MTWRAGLLGRMLGVHSPGGHIHGVCWCQRAASDLVGRRARFHDGGVLENRTGWIRAQASPYYDEWWVEVDNLAGMHIVGRKEIQIVADDTQDWTAMMGD